MMDLTLRDRLENYVSKDLIDRLPDVDSMTEIIRHLGGLQRAFTSFIPQYVADDETLLERDFGRLRPGTFLFADVSGFTALSEKLQLHGGSEGAETLTLVINDYFSTMLEILAKSDGQLLKFAGDALLAFFPSGSDDDAVKAIRTGLRMQRAMMEKFQPIKTKELEQLLGEHQQQLSMSIGLSRGDLFEAFIGNKLQRDHQIQGHLPGLAMDAEGVGDRDDVIIDQKLFETHGHLFETIPLEEGFYQVSDTLGNQLDDYEFNILGRRRAKSSALFDFDADTLMQSLIEQLDKVERVGRFIAPNVRRELINTPDKLQSQNRLVITMFMHVTGFAEMLERWGRESLDQVTAVLDRYYSIVQRVINDHGGTITRTDPYQLGCKVLVTFGALVANPDDPQRAVAAAQEMHHQLNLFCDRLREDFPAEQHAEDLIRQRIGITFGPVFAGEVGWRARREYTVMGDDVNLAARLMSKAAFGTTLISERVYQRVSDVFEAESQSPMQLKGKSKPIQTFIVQKTRTISSTMASTSATPFVGQELLLNMLSFALKRSKDLGRRRAFALTGDAGLGKTRIAKQVVLQAQAEGYHVAWATCALKNDRKTTWANIISQLLKIDTLTNPEQRRQEVRKQLGALGLLPLESAFNDLLGTSDTAATSAPAPSAPPSEESREITESSGIFNLAKKKTEPDNKRSGLFSLANNRLSEVDQKEETSEIGKLSTTELYKNADMRSSLIEAVGNFVRTFTYIHPTLIVIDDLHRENPQAMQLIKHVLEENSSMRLLILLTYEPLQEELKAQAVEVGDLNEAETYLMASKVLMVEHIGPRLQHLIWSRTNGRPLFIESLLQTLSDNHQLVDQDDMAELSANANIEAIPDDVRKLVISRVDRLTPQAQSFLRATSVLGESFTTSAVSVISGMSSPDEVTTLLHELTRNQLFEKRGEDVYHFRHGMTQRAIYESLPRIMRQKLHRAAAEYWMTQADWERQPMMVAHHWANGGMPTRAIQIITSAAEQAERSHDVELAIELYTQALEIFPTETSWQEQLRRLQNL